ncbi:TauD/TfdA family dioxygenase [Streptomyces sp. RB6PN25]|uniref:TauD/TfdA family dioxygenase n=1 Tax=Streptomyces humicola TaxID=2953240 RepID=A0ABT1PN89_9ACTN|nr:TauD/TfdA family dioxygenase [Streptomyces humicola]MCQ4079144.1 TauD/TfdA family dioxygenase [Streptomyces humicola]
MSAPTLLPPLWLRDNCGCADCRDPRNGQKLFQIDELPEDLAVAEARELDGGWEVRWAPDGHSSFYPREFAFALSEAPPDPRTETAKQLWQAADLTGCLPEAEWTAYRQDPAVAERVLGDVARLGFCLLRGVPATSGKSLEVAESFGFVRETNYGRLFEVRVEENPNNLAFTSARITPHTDNPYRDPVPTLQILHCLANEVEGGDSGLVDGFAAAALLRAEDPEGFAVLTRTPVPFRFADQNTELSAEHPLIAVDPLGQIREVRFNNRSTATLRLPAVELDAFYRAYRRFAALLLRPALRLDFRLVPEDCLIFDNTRLLHARTAFDSGGRRLLQGCYADLDGLLSTLTVLRRDRQDHA